MISINQAHINDGEQYVVPENAEIIGALVKAAFGKDTLYLPMHHLAFQTGKPIENPQGIKLRDGDIYEMASLETFLFNHGVAKLLIGDNYIEWLRYLATVPELERLAWIEERRAQWDRGQNDN